MYLIGIRVDDSNRVTEQIRYNDLAVVNLNNIKTIIKSNQFVANVSVFKDKAKYLRAYEYFIEKMNHQMDIILKSFVGVMPPEPVHHHYEKPFSLEIDINTFQVPFIRRYKVDFEELNSPKGEGYRRLRFKTNPSFEFIKQVLMLNDNWNYDISINDKRISNETSLEVVNNDSSVNAWIRDYLKQSHRRSLINYEDNPIIKRELEKEIKDWERNQDNPQTSVTYPFTCD
ncbi:hypothetical protein MY04_5337 [Flammeovirga sp. MY04]|uniref:hypothetical protein n=1 Tax=Flammeovirga sp. MY04 TaxID=1191459 RepID=UPI0008061B8C|nr:hypothetical protein [Flammeovirga sp. MY04]ANQ52669.1 hypothetical protein MY04_5337 [Flammeovirga sp. MY04]